MLTAARHKTTVPGSAPYCAGILNRSLFDYNDFL